MNQNIPVWGYSIQERLNGNCFRYVQKTYSTRQNHMEGGGASAVVNVERPNNYLSKTRFERLRFQ